MYAYLYLFRIDFNLSLIQIHSSGVLGTILCLVIVSTGYDIYCTIYDCMFSWIVFWNDDNFGVFCQCSGKKSAAGLTFSFYTNGKELLSIKQSTSSDEINCLHGIRTISSQWIVLGHVAIIFVIQPFQNWNYLHEVFDDSNSTIYYLKYFFILAS